jgi:1-acyl-sn-glycerol-3-phosphate acyltransferase
LPAGTDRRIAAIAGIRFRGGILLRVTLNDKTVHGTRPSGEARPCRRLFALRAWTALALCAPLAWLAMVLLPDPAKRWRGMRLFCRLVLRLAGIRFAIRGGEVLTAARGPCIIVSNHTSFLDVVLLGATLPRPVRYVAKAELARRWTTRWPLTGIATLFVERFDRRRALGDYRHIVATARDGPPLLFFAEGTLQAEPGLLPFQPGAFVCAAAARLAIVPIAITGMRAILPGDSRCPGPGAGTVTILPPVTVDDTHLRRGEIAERLRGETRARILAVVGEPDLPDTPLA